MASGVRRSAHTGFRRGGSNGDSPVSKPGGMVRIHAPLPPTPLPRTAGFTAGGESTQLGDHLDLNAATERQLGDAKGRARVLACLAEDLTE